MRLALEEAPRSVVAASALRSGEERVRKTGEVVPPLLAPEGPGLSGEHLSIGNPISIEGRPSPHANSLIQ